MAALLTHLCPIQPRMGGAPKLWLGQTPAGGYIGLHHSVERSQRNHFRINMPEDESLLSTHDEQLKSMMEQVHASSLLQVDAVKVRISHQEKLMGLCAGTLALSFTAATTVHAQHTLQASSLAQLFRAWQLLLSAIVVGVVSNWLSVNGLSNFTGYLGMKQTDVYFSFLERTLLKLAPSYAQQEREAWNHESKRLSRLSKTANILIRTAAIVGLLAQILAFSGFLFLYFFAKSVLCI
jgi:uncharacterized membrane protein (DUF441 family)